MAKAKFNIEPELQKILGCKKCEFTQITKKFWDYVKKNGLQDEENKRNINLDANLKVIFGKKKQITMFEVGKGIRDYYHKAE